MAIDVTFDFHSDANGGDPDATSPTLRDYHRRLWRRPLPDGRAFELSTTKPRTYLHHHRSTCGDFVLSIAPGCDRCLGLRLVNVPTACSQTLWSGLIAYMLPIMNSPGALLTAARTDAGLSMHALAARAQVAYTTVSRIEHGQVDPTTGMLTRLLAAAGRRLEFSAHDHATPQLADLVDAWRTTGGQARPDWTRLRAFLDLLALQPGIAGPATLRMPAPSGSELMDNLLAGIAEKVSDDNDLPRPTWTKCVPRLAERWTGDGTPRMRAEAEALTPEQLSARGITLRADSLWRDSTTVGL